MSAEILDEKISAGSPSAIDLARSLGPAARPIARQHLTSPDPQSRRVAVHCLEAAGDPTDLPAVLPLLRDPNPDVGAAAAVAIRRIHGSAAGYGGMMLEGFTSAPNPALKVELALALGERADPSTDVLSGLWKDEKNPLVKRALGAALAKRGFPPALHALTDTIERGKLDAKKEALDDAGYAKRRELLPALRTALDDAGKLEPFVPCRATEERWLRVHDLAAWAIAETTGATFSFAEEGYIELDASKRDEAKKTVDEILGAEK